MPPDKLTEANSFYEFKDNASTREYQCFLADQQKHRILDILPDRTQSHVADYCRGIPIKERLNANFFVCDMWLTYAKLVITLYPNAKIIVDEYHVI